MAVDSVPMTIDPRLLIGNTENIQDMPMEVDHDGRCGGAVEEDPMTMEKDPGSIHNLRGDKGKKKVPVKKSDVNKNGEEETSEEETTSEEEEAEKKKKKARKGKGHSNKVGKVKDKAVREGEPESEERMDDRPLTPLPNQLQIAMQSQFTSFLPPAARYDLLNAESSKIVLPDQVTENGLTSKQASLFLGSLLGLSEKNRALLLELPQEEVTSGLEGILMPNKRKDVKHMESPKRKRVRHRSSSPLTPTSE